MSYLQTEAAFSAPRATQEFDVPVPGLSKTVDILKTDRFVLRQKGEFYYDSSSYPMLPSPRHVIVRVVATGICGSDACIPTYCSGLPLTLPAAQVHYWRHGEIGEFKVKSPLVLGHESAGIVHSCGSDVTLLRPGDRVAMEPGTPCQTCHFCRGGKYNLCSKMRFAATPPYDGTLATYYALPEDFCFKIPNHISFQEAALVEPLSVAVHCARLASVGPGSSVIVFGAGPIGLLCCAVARAFGASTVMATDILAARLEFAKSYAATHIFLMGTGSPAEQAATIRAEAMLTGGADIVIDATGVESCIQCGINALARGGTFVQAGLGRPQITFPVGELCSKEGVYKGSFRYGPGDYELAVKLLDKGDVSVQELITHEYGFWEAETAFENVSKQQGIKSIIYGPGVSVVDRDWPRELRESL